MYEEIERAGNRRRSQLIRDLLIKGWRTQHGRFEINPANPDMSDPIYRSSMPVERVLDEQQRPIALVTGEDPLDGELG